MFEYIEKGSTDFGSSFPKCKNAYQCAAGTKKKSLGTTSKPIWTCTTNPKKQSSSGTDSEVLATMRRLYPDELSDGVYPSTTLPWEEEHKLLSMKNERKGTRLEWIKRQENVGVPISKEVLELHEIVFLERFRNAGQTYEWIPKSENNEATNDLFWINHNTQAEVKSVSKTDYGLIANRIKNAVSKAKNMALPKTCLSLTAEMRNYQKNWLPN